MIFRTDLSGLWDFSFDRSYCDDISLPNTTSNARKGKPNPKAETGCLTDTYAYSGKAWFARNAVFEKRGVRAVIFLERTRITQLYIDGNLIGECDSLCAPHIYDVSKFCDGRKHRIEICVSNVGYKTRGGHMTSPDTQTNWLGITGRIELRYFGKTYSDNIRIDSDLDLKRFIVTGDIIGAPAERVTVSVEKDGEVSSAQARISGSKFFAAVSPCGEAQLWSDRSPSLYRITVDTDGDKSSFTAGMRKLSCDGGKFIINGEKTFMRGKHDGMIFPLTGYAPTDVESWLKVMKTAKDYGINHYRFHTCCPPEAAFEAADILGIYMSPELPFWGTIAAPGEEGFNAEEQEYLISEGLRILAAFGNHPSFCMMSMGNELWGNPKRINEIMGKLREFDGRPLYTQGSNNFQFFPNTVENDDYFVGVRLSKERLIRGSYAMCDAPLGHVQTDEPSTLKDYDAAVLGTGEGESAGGTISIQYGTGVKEVKTEGSQGGFKPDIPIITHEIGQYETYPNFCEIEKYTGSLKPRNLEIFRERLEKAGLGELADDYFKASGALAVSCYKEELEAVLRSKTLAGCQILDIQDFSGQGTALVGILDAFMDSKGLISAKQWREFFSQTVILVRFEKYVYTQGESFCADIQLTDFGGISYAGKRLCWSLGESGGSFVIPPYENYADIGRIETTISGDCLKLWIEESDIGNHYVFDIIRAVEKLDTAGCLIKRELDDEAKESLSRGETVILSRLPDPESSIEGFYCTDFWCYPMFSNISNSMGKQVPVGTMGLLIDNSHPALKGFSCKRFSTPMWYKPVSLSRSEIIDGQTDKRVIVRTIDNFARNHSLALIYEYDCLGGKVLVCNADFASLADSPEGRALAQSLIDYAREKKTTSDK